MPMDTKHQQRKDQWTFVFSTVEPEYKKYTNEFRVENHSYPLSSNNALVPQNNMPSSNTIYRMKVSYILNPIQN